MIVHVDSGAGMLVILWGICHELGLIEQLKKNELIQTTTGKTIWSKIIIRALFAFVADIHYYFDVIVIKGLAHPMLVGVNLLCILKAIIDFDMATLTIPSTSSVDAKVLLLLKHIDGKGIWSRCCVVKNIVCNIVKRTTLSPNTIKDLRLKRWSRE